MVIKFHKACILLTRSSFCIGLFFVIFFIAYYALWFLLDLNETFSSSHYKLKVASAMKRGTSAFLLLLLYFCIVAFKVIGLFQTKKIQNAAQEQWVFSKNLKLQ